MRPRPTQCQQALFVFSLRVDSTTTFTLLWGGRGECPEEREFSNIRDIPELRNMSEMRVCVRRGGTESNDAVY